MACIEKRAVCFCDRSTLMIAKLDFAKTINAAAPRISAGVYCMCMGFAGEMR